MELRWLHAPDDEVAAAMAAVRRSSRPAWVPNRRQVVLHVNYSLILWYLCIAFLMIGIRVDVLQGGQATAADIAGGGVTLIVLAAWACGTFWLHRWVARPPSPRARLREWRQILTALANGFESQPRQRATFTSLITTAGRDVRGHPRFVASNIEFGNLADARRRTGSWHYLAVKLPAPLPHLILDAKSNNTLVSDLPFGVDPAQNISLEGDFDKWFRVYAPAQYQSDALYILTPSVMVALIDNARGYNVEIVDNTLLFFDSSVADFNSAERWQTLQAILDTVALPIVASARRYRDERVPGQEMPPVISAIESALRHPELTWVAPPRRIGADGSRLHLRTSSARLRSALGAVGWFTLRTLLYAVPGIFAFAGLMSIVDGW